MSENIKEAPREPDGRIYIIEHEGKFRWTLCDPLRPDSANPIAASTTTFPSMELALYEVCLTPGVNILPVYLATESGDKLLTPITTALKCISAPDAASLTNSMRQMLELLKIKNLMEDLEEPDVSIKAMVTVWATCICKALGIPMKYKVISTEDNGQ